MSIEKTLKELEALRAKATPSPWATDHDIGSPLPQIGCLRFKKPGDDRWWALGYIGGHSDEKPDEHNAALIVALVNAFPALKEEIERLRGALAFYADKKNYKVRKKSGFARNKASGHYTKTISPKVMFDKGHIARRTLKGDRDDE